MLKLVCNVEFGVNKRLALGLPRAELQGLEHLKKNLKGFDHQQVPRINMITDSMFCLCNGFLYWERIILSK